MKVFVIGGASLPNSDPEYQTQLGMLQVAMQRIGKDLVSTGHDLLVCSPFQGSADAAAVRGAAEIMGRSDAAVVEFHCPDSSEVQRELTHLTESLSLTSFRVYSHPLPSDEHGKEQWSYGWLLAQLAAMDRSQAVVSLGGKLTASASLLLSLAESRRRAVLPFTFLGGASAQSFQRRRYELEDVLQEKLAALHNVERIGETSALLERLVSAQLIRTMQQAPVRFFLSYPKCRPQEADFVEITLRRRNFEVYRDERDFGAGRPLTGEITEGIHRANVFVAIWCREYACSPWCFDELELAIKRGKTLWLLCVDDTRIVPPAARNLISYPARSREALERHVLTLLEQIRVSST
jgi:TIR domain